MIIKDALHILFRRVQPEFVIQSWLDSVQGNDMPKHEFSLSKNPSFEQIFISALQNEFPHYSADECRYAFRYILEYELGAIGSSKDFGVFGLIAKSVEDILITDTANECLCKYKELLQFRNLTHPIDPTIFVAAHLAKYDAELGFCRDRFAWSPIVRTNNTNLHKILSNGMAENHFHIGGSSNAFLFSWICLMNHFPPERKSEFEDESINREALDTVYIGTNTRQDSNYLLTFKAVCIRYYLYMLLRGEKAYLPDYQPGCTEPPDDDDLRKINFDWLKKMMSLTEEDCQLEMNTVDSYLKTMRNLCTPVDHTGFIPDYALKDEPLAPMYDSDCDYCDVAVRDYERRLYRPLAGEQRFLYALFKAIFNKDKQLEPYLDLVYAYLLIYCRLRGELIQANNRTGFGNFLKYQDRKDLFTEKYPEYDNMRTGIAQRAVLENPQVVSFEGRFCPSDNADKLIMKLNNFIDCGTKSICGVSDYYNEDLNATETHINENKLREKMHFVVHFPKTAQPISDNEDFELLAPRDSRLRDYTMRQADAVIKARCQKPELLKYVTGIDACSSEIDCRPEVFACAMRKICQHRSYSDFILKPQLTDIHITYHAGEDFLDPLSGLRAIDEAITFCNMLPGDRLGHALALGIDCEDWYFQKNHTVLMRAQELLDNMVWLGSNLNRFNIINKAAENEIDNYFHKLFAKIYQENQEVGDGILNGIDMLQYFKSMRLRGNDPSLYIHNPWTERILFNKDWNEVEAWQVLGQSAGELNTVSNLLYHYYHYNFKMKKASDNIVRYTVPKAIIDSVCALQEKMQYEIASQGIGVECNPSSNFLIGNFKDYLKHPIFRFNNKGLFPANDARFALKNPHISVSLNTDDLGIFDTSLENEYALMAAALENYNCVTDGSIPTDHIYQWLNNVRELGCSQSFSKYKRK